MAETELEGEIRRIEKYLLELERSHRQLATENAQLRVSHSYRLGHAFVMFAKRPRLSGIASLFRAIRAAMRPMTAPAPAPLKRPGGKLTLARFAGQQQRVAQDALAKAVDEAPVGSAVAQRIGGKPARVAGIFGSDIAAKLGGAAARASLPFDRYDADWAAMQPTHLLVDTDQLAHAFGWENAFTLRDPGATVEMAAMLQKARLGQMRTVLIEPSEAYRFPLLSRARMLFDVRIPRAEATGERLAAL